MTDGTRKVESFFICTAETPWSEGLDDDRRVKHRDVREVGEQRDGWPGGDIVTMECKNCGARWKSELPQ